MSETKSAAVPPKDAKESSVIDANAAPTPQQPPIKFDILKWIKQTHHKRGAKDQNYIRYARYCARRLHRIRASLKLSQGTGNRHSKYKRRDLDPSQPMGPEHLSIPLIQSERAWAQAMHLQSEVSQEQPRKRQHMIRRLMRAVQASKQLNAICAIVADEATQLQAQAYSLGCFGQLSLERDDWATALKCFSTAESIYKQLGQVSDLELRSLCDDRAAELALFVTFCASRLKRLDPSAASLLSMQGQAAAATSSILQAKLQAVMDASLKSQTTVMRTVEWQGKHLEVRSEKLRLLLLESLSINNNIRDILSGKVDSSATSTSSTSSSSSSSSGSGSSASSSTSTSNVDGDDDVDDDDDDDDDDDEGKLPAGDASAASGAAEGSTSASGAAVAASSKKAAAAEAKARRTAFTQSLNAQFNRLMAIYDDATLAIKDDVRERQSAKVRSAAIEAELHTLGGLLSYVAFLRLQTSLQLNARTAESLRQRFERQEALQSAKGAMAQSRRAKKQLTALKPQALVTVFERLLQNVSDLAQSAEASATITATPSTSAADDAAARSTAATALASTKALIAARRLGIEAFRTYYLAKTHADLGNAAAHFALLTRTIERCKEATQAIEQQMKGLAGAKLTDETFLRADDLGPELARVQALGLAAERQRVKINAAYLLEQEKLAELQRAKQVGASTTTSSSSTSTSTSATSTSSASGSSSSGAGAGAGAGGDRLLLNRLDVFEAGPVGHHYSLTEFPPSLVAVAPKPALFDLAVNGITYPDISGRVKAAPVVQQQKSLWGRLWGS